MNVYRVLRPWNVNTATWEQADVGSDWAIDGAQGNADRAASPTDSKVLAGLGWIEFDVTDDVDAFA